MSVSRVKDPNEVQTYTNDWQYALDTGETISTSSWTVDSGLTKDSETNDTTTATVTVSGGTAATTYKAVNRVVTSAGRTLDDTTFIEVRHK